jgi:hypothetical protein
LFSFVAFSAFLTSSRIESLERITRPSTATRLPVLRVLRALSNTSFSRNVSSLRSSVASVFLSSPKIRSSRIKARLRGLSTPREMTSSTRSSKGIIGGVLSLDRSLRIRGTSSRRLESSSSKGIPIEGGSSVESIISGLKGYIPDFLKAD